MTKVGIKITIFLGLVALASVLIWVVAAQADEADKKEKPEIKHEKIIRTEFTKRELNTDGASPLASKDMDQLELGERPMGGGFESDRIYTSEVITTDFKFNAIGVHWKYDQPQNTDLKIEIRVSDGEVWDDWQELDSDSFIIRDDDKINQEIEAKETYSDLVFVESGQSFQYRVTLKTRDYRVSPQLDEIEFHYIDSIDGPKASEHEEGWFKKAHAAEIANAPKIISRTEWGCPQGETSPEWLPQTASKTYHVFHHTATTNGAEPYSMVRAIWQYHYSRTWEGGIWGDIGYNYLVDQYGRIFKGRNGPHDVIGAHTYGYNTRSIGVAVLGNYQTVNPSSAALSGLSTIIGYSGAATNMNSIKLYGHRELTPTACPGDRLFAKRADIVYTSRQKLAQYTDDVVRYDSQIYYRNDNTLHKIESEDLLRSWGFSENNIRDINEVEFISYILGADLDYFARNDSEAFIAVGGRLRTVHLGYLSTRWGKNFEELLYLPRLIVRRAKIGSVSFLVRSPSTGMVFYLPGDNYKQWIARAVFRARGYRIDYDRIPNVSSVLLNKYMTRGGLSYLDGTHFKRVVYYGGDNDYPSGHYYHETTYLRWLPTMDIFLNYGFSVSEDVRRIEKEEFDTYLKARDLGYFTRSDSEAFVAVGGGLRRVHLGYLSSRWGIDFAAVEINRGLVRRLPKREPVNFLVRSPLQGDIYYMAGQGQRKLVFGSVFRNRNFYGGDLKRVPTIPTSFIGSYQNGGHLFYKNGTLIRRVGSSGIYYMENEEKRWISNSVWMSWGFRPAQVLDVTISMFGLIPDGYSFPPKKLTTLLGPYGAPVRLPAYSGTTAREQHLYLNEAEAALGRTWAATQLHYQNSNTPSAVRVSGINDMAGGYGAFGIGASVLQERWYVNMRWLYCDWYQDAQGVTRVRNCDPILKDWHRHKKLIVTNPSNGKSVVVSIEEAGPAIWTGRVSGLSPEAMWAIGAVTNDNLTYYWAGSQTIPLGPIN